MSYKTIYALAADQNLRNRVAACAAQEGADHPESWSQTHSLRWAASPGWADAYRQAVDTGVSDPGADETIITDGMILATVQPMIHQE